ncbi:hypothetical protein ACH4UM_31220 [Streptomyces sp. NPDC020801]|uniref:hypothetical protein n=1 Tax=unclassified Streptomyces TaxID=2593676 RepID=UPI0037A3B1E3
MGTAARRLIGLISAGAALSATALALAPPATAGTGHGCPGLRLCFYKTEADWTLEHPTVAYHEITRDPQDLGPQAYGSYAVYSALGDVRAILTLRDSADGRLHGICVSPGETRVLHPETVTTVHIDEKPGC